MKQSILKSVLVGITLCSSPQMFAQTTQACSSVASDPDGDGYGWENNASCRVTGSSSGEPAFINMLTGAPVNLSRAYWDGERDFVEDVSCNEFNFDGKGYAFIRGGFLHHSPLTTEAPFVGIVSLLTDVNRNHIWGVENGIYSGPFGIGASPWVEIIDFGSQPSSAIRTWTSDYTYFECWSPNPNHSFVPTGSAPVTGSIFNDGTCVDTTPVGDGWGWNGTSSCRVSATQNDEPVCVDSIPFGDGWGWNGTSSCQIGINANSTQSACDYSDAGLYDGWGWNPVTQESCAPSD